MARHNDLGKEGERLAADFLRRENYEILEMNWTFHKAEVDILARTEDTLVAVEVKTRSDAGFGLPQHFVSSKKIRLLVDAVNHYSESIGFEGDVRFDIVAVLVRDGKWEIDHIQDAFYHF